MQSKSWQELSQNNWIIHCFFLILQLYKNEINHISPLTSFNHFEIMLFLLTTHITSIKFYFIGNLVYISQYFENLQFEVFPLVCCAASLCSNLKLGNCCRLSASGKLPNIKQKRSLKKEEENIWSAKNFQLQANSKISNSNDLRPHLWQYCNFLIPADSIH